MILHCVRFHLEEQMHAAYPNRSHQLDQICHHWNMMWFNLLALLSCCSLITWSCLSFCNLISKPHMSCSSPVRLSWIGHVAPQGNLKLFSFCSRKLSRRTIVMLADKWYAQHFNSVSPAILLLLVNDLIWLSSFNLIHFSQINRSSWIYTFSVAISSSTIFSRYMEREQIRQVILVLFTCL